MKLWHIVSAFFLIGLLVVAAIFLTTEGAIALLFGWAFFIARVLPQLTVDWPTVAVGGAATVLFAIFFHRLARACLSARSPAPESFEPHWKVRSTAMSVSVVFLFFAAGIALIGAVHQLVWLFDSDKPLLVEELARRSNPTNNMKMIGLGMGNYNDTYGKLPYGGTFSTDGTMLHSWETQMLPFMGITLPGVDPNRPWNDPVNQPYFHSVLSEFINPTLGTPPLEDADHYGLSHFAVNSRVMGGGCTMPLQRCTSNTILVGEVNDNFKPWGHPVNWRDPATGINRSANGFGGPRGAGGAQFLMADASVRFISDRTDPAVLRALSSPTGGNENGESK
jgi:Protein of unknown function (DUF1559)